MVAALASAASRSDAGPLKAHRATRTSSRPRIDGRLDEAAWQLALPDDRFVQNFPDEGRPPTQRTVLRVLFDDDALYVGVRCFDDRPREIVERRTRRDRDTQADKITVDLDSKNDGKSAYHFDVNVSGVLADGVRFNDTDYNGDWDGLWEAATHRDSEGWSAELRIPLRTLRYDGRSDHFGLQVRRLIQRRQEIDEWAPIPRSQPNEVSRYCALTGLDGLHARRLIQIAPFVAGKLILRANQPPLDGLTAAGQLGADLKVGLTSALTLDATLLPDFGQVEADQVVLNLTTYEVQYPEKRPFFLEGAELFATPFQLFYSRRIGRVPPPPNLASDETQVEPSPDGQIWLAAKLTGLIGHRLTVAALDAVTAQEEVAVEQGGVVRRRLVEPLTNFAVVRLKQELLQQSSVGVTATAVTRFEPAVLGQPRITHDAYTGGADLVLRTRDGTWRAFAHGVASVIVDGPPRTLDDGTVIGPSDGGGGLIAEAGKYGGEHLLFRQEYWGMSPKLDLNDAGFLQRANLHHIHSFVTLRTTKPVGPFREGNIEGQVVVEQSWYGAALRRSFVVDAWVNFKNYWQIYTQFNWNLRHQDDREARDGAFVERTEGFHYELLGKTDPRRKVVLAAWTGIDRVLRGLSFAFEGSISLRPIPSLELDLLPRGSYASGDPRWFQTVDNGDGSRVYWFGDLESRSFDVTLRATYTFVPTLTLQAYAQLFLASGHYGPLVTQAGTGTRPVLAIDAFQPALGAPPGGSPDFREGTLNAQLVLRWEYRPGATLIAVWSHSSLQTAFDPLSEGEGRLRINRFNRGPSTDLFLIKITALWG